jgi:hypothetical protein
MLRRGSWLCALALGCASSSARADEDRDRTAAAYSGFHWGASPGVLISTQGNAAFALSAYAGYGVDTGTVVIVPGLSVGAILPRDGSVVSATPQVQFVIPVSIVAPFVEIGAGPAYITPPGKPYLMGRVGGGLVVHPSPSFAIGAAVGYVRVFGTDVSGITIAPILAIGF